jgi:hypothetical protein
LRLDVERDGFHLNFDLQSHQPGELIGGGEDDPHSAVVQHTRERFVAELWIEWHCNSSEAYGGQACDNPLGTVSSKQSHRVSRENTGMDQAVRKTLYQIGYSSVGPSVDPFVLHGKNGWPVTEPTKPVSETPQRL